MFGAVPVQSEATRVKREFSGSLCPSPLPSLLNGVACFVKVVRVYQPWPDLRKERCEITMTESKSKGRVLLRRLIAYVTALALVFVILIFGAPLTFYFSFQQSLESVVANAGSTSVIVRRPEMLNIAFAETPEVGSSRGEWPVVVEGDVQFRVPPGDIKQISKKDRTVVVNYEQGELRLDRLPTDFILSTYCEIFRMFDVAEQELQGLLLQMSQEDLLARISRVTLDDYRFGFDETERAFYSADILTKMLLWEIDGDDSPFVLMNAADRKGVFFRRGSTSAKVIVVCPQGCFLYTLEGVPSSPPRECDAWLSIEPVSDV